LPREGDHPFVGFRVDMGEDMPPFRVGGPYQDVIDVLGHVPVESVLEAV
jgi:hypothetical protein